MEGGLVVLVATGRKEELGRLICRRKGTRDRFCSGRMCNGFNAYVPIVFRTGSVVDCDLHGKD